MRFLPFTRFAVETGLSRDEVAQRIDRSIYPPRPWWHLGFGRRTGFEGEVSLNGFQLKRIIGYRNSFLPVAYGSFVDIDSGRTRVEVVLTVHPAVALCCVVWAGSVGVGFVGAIVHWWRSGTDANAMAWLGGMLVFFYVLAMVGWGAEVGRVRRFITGLFSPGYRA